MLSDILPTGFECGVLNGRVQAGSTRRDRRLRPDRPRGLLTAQFYSPAEIIMIDLDDNRLAIAKVSAPPPMNGKPTARRSEGHED